MKALRRFTLRVRCRWDEEEVEEEVEEIVEEEAGTKVGKGRS